MQSKIDFVITWVDGNDRLWQQEKNKYQLNLNADTREVRYRDWELLKYWFRGVEKFAPWVNNIYFVTWGHVPEWLDINHDKLKIVRHDEFIPSKYLPTFCSRPIDMNLHRIKGLEEKFVYFNDDMFLINKVNENDFFKNGKPCEVAILNASSAGISGTEIKEKNNASSVYLAATYSFVLANLYFKKNEVLKKNFFKWINLKYGKYLFRTLFNLPYANIHGLCTFHIPYSYKKTTYEKVWQLEEDALNETCMHKFRKNNDLNHLIFSYYQILEGQFSPRSYKFGRKVNIKDKDNDKIYNLIKKSKYKVICINDNVYDKNNFKNIKDEIIECFEKKFPDKSSFEL